VSTVGELVAALEAAYPPELAESWDAVGLVCGDPSESTDQVLICVDPVDSTVDEAIERGAGLIVAHHPLLLRGVHGVPASTPKGSLVHRLIRANVALYCAHTNADSASPGVSDALAEAIGLTVRGPLSGEGPTGLGRIGDLPEPMKLGDFARQVADALPETVTGVRAARHREDQS
jgi:dinuclear metal center YbgI/SA1388 family protein